MLYNDNNIEYFSFNDFFNSTYNVYCDLIYVMVLFYVSRSLSMTFLFNCRICACLVPL